REMERQGYPEDPIVFYQKAKEIGNMRDTWLAIGMILDGVNTKKDPKRADELWIDYWCTDVLPAFANRPELVLPTLKAAAVRGVPSAMLRFSEANAKGQFGQAVNADAAADWKRKYDAAAVKLGKKPD